MFSFTQENIYKYLWNITKKCDYKYDLFALTDGISHHNGNDSNECNLAKREWIRFLRKNGLINRIGKYTNSKLYEIVQFLGKKKNYEITNYGIRRDSNIRKNHHNYFSITVDEKEHQFQIPEDSSNSVTTLLNEFVFDAFYDNSPFIKNL